MDTKSKIVLVDDGCVSDATVEKLRSERNVIVIDPEKLDKNTNQLLEDELEQGAIYHNPYTEYLKNNIDYTLVDLDSIRSAFGVTKKQLTEICEPVRTEPKIGRNTLCSCGSGRKFKKCCKKIKS